MMWHSSGKSACSSLRTILLRQRPQEQQQAEREHEQQQEDHKEEEEEEEEFEEFAHLLVVPLALCLPRPHRGL